MWIGQLYLIAKCTIFLRKQTRFYKTVQSKQVKCGDDGVCDGDGRLCCVHFSKIDVMGVRGGVVEFCKYFLKNRNIVRPCDQMGLKAAPCKSTQVSTGWMSSHERWYCQALGDNWHCGATFPSLPVWGLWFMCLSCPFMQAGRCSCLIML